MSPGAIAVRRTRAARRTALVLGAFAVLVYTGFLLIAAQGSP